NVPVFAIAPLLVVWFGYGFLPKVLMAAIIVFFPITVSTLDGLKRTDPDLVRLFRTMGATPAQMLWKLRVPAALPALFSGLKISAVYSTIGAVIGEWVGAGAGLGYLMLSANAQLRVAEVFGATYSPANDSRASRLSARSGLCTWTTSNEPRNSASSCCCRG
ncbi:MAG: ABC transporter permease, partial [Bacteroidetes bacterium]|nr:ABC transporter permease [Bacteroidota bacterium]